MSETAALRARLEPEPKDRAEGVFQKLGLNPTQAITVFCRQVELRG